jgi:hypothetical protein
LDGKFAKASFQKVVHTPDWEGELVPEDRANMPILWDLTQLEDKPVEKKRIEGDLRIITSLIDKAKLLLKESKITNDANLPTKIVGVEVGDDRLDASRNPQVLAESLIGQEQVFRMITSKEDTFLSSWVWNLCEHTDAIPFSPDQCWNRTRKSGNSKHLAFTDYPPLRVIADVGGSNQDHLKSVTGKASLLANQSQLTRPECTFVMEVAHFLQDGLISSYRGNEPKYLPKSLGGCGCPLPFGLWENLYLSVLGFRGGGYSRVYGSVTSEAHDTLIAMENGAKSVSTPLLNRIRMKQEYLYGTYANQILIPSQKQLASYRDKLPEPLYEGKTVESYLFGTEERIVRARLLLRRREAEIEVERTNRSQLQLFGHTRVAETLLRDKMQSQKARNAFEGALSANTAFKNLLDKKGSREDSKYLMHHGFDVSVSGVQEFSVEHAQWIASGAKTEVYYIEDIPRSEDIFIRDEVSSEESLKVGGITLRPLQGKKNQPFQVTTTKVGLYEIGPGMLEWANDKVETLRNLRDAKGRIDRKDLLAVYSHNPEWVRDDSLLIGVAIQKSMVTPLGKPLYYIGTDKKLARRIANSTFRQVYMLHPTLLVARLGLKSISAKTEIPLKSINEVVAKNHHFIEPGFVLQDSGSILAHTMKMEKDEKKNKFFRRELVSYGNDGPKGRRKAHYRLEPVIGELRYLTISPIKKELRASAKARDVYHLGVESNWRRRPSSSSSGSLGRKSR